MFTQTKRYLAGLLAFGMSMVVGHSALAIGTASNTTVTNDVSVDYQVSGVNQPQLTDTVSFVVDNKVDLSIGVTNDTVIPGQSNQVLTFVITNDGNTTQGYALTAANSSIADDFNMNNVRIYIEDTVAGVAGFDATDDLYTSGSGTNAGDVLANGTLTVYIVSDVPPTGGGVAPANTNAARYDLLVTTLDAGTNTATADSSAAALNAATVQVVYAEGAAGPHASDALNDGELSATGTYTVSSAALTVTKTQSVVSDGFSIVNPKAIPGATVRYTITLNNSGGAVDATNLIVRDDFDDASTTYTVNTTDVTITGVGTDNNITDGGTGANTGATVTISDQGGVAAKSDRVQVSGFTVPAGQTATITFDVTVD